MQFVGFSSFWLFLSISCCLSLLFASHYVIKNLFNIILLPNTSCAGVSYNVVWYVLHTAKVVSAMIPDQA